MSTTRRAFTGGLVAAVAAALLSAAPAVSQASGRVVGSRVAADIPAVRGAAGGRVHRLRVTVRPAGQRYTVTVRSNARVVRVRLVRAGADRVLRAHLAGSRRVRVVAPAGTRRVVVVTVADRRGRPARVTRPVPARPTPIPAPVPVGPGPAPGGSPTPGPQPSVTPPVGGDVAAARQGMLDRINYWRAAGVTCRTPGSDYSRYFAPAPAVTRHAGLQPARRRARDVSLVRSGPRGRAAPRAATCRRPDGQRFRGAPLPPVLHAASGLRRA